ncbi:MAG: Ig-like domain-containing protein [Cyclobacteriaceae bacterium]
MKRKLLYSILLMVHLWSCGDDEPTRTLTELTLATGQNDNTLSVNDVVVVIAEGLDQNGQPLDITDLTYSTSDETIATVSNDGTVTGISFGKVLITARAGNVSEQIDIKVFDETLPNMEIFISDAGGFANPPWKILRFDKYGENPSVFTEENISWPQDIIFIDDKVIISNLNSGQITEYDVTTGQYLGVFAENIGGPTRMKIGPDGLLYVLQWSGNGRVLRYNTDGTFVDQFTSAGVAQSIGLDWDEGGNLYVSSFNMGSNGFIRKFDSNGNDLGNHIASNLQGPTDIWFDSNNHLIVNDYGANRVKRFNGSNYVGDVVTGISQPEGIGILPNAYHLIGSSGSGSVKLYDQDYNPKGDWITSLGSGLIAPNAVSIRIIE